MAVDGINGVNPNHNAVVIGAGAGAGALVGAGLGATYGVMSKPYLNGLLPTDKFMSQTLENLTKSSDAEVKGVATFVKDAVETLKNAKTGSDLAPLLDKPIDKLLNAMSGENFKAAIDQCKKMAEGAGEAIPKELQTVLDNLTKDGDIVQVLKNTVEQLGDKVPAELKTVLESINTKEELSKILKTLGEMQLVELDVPNLKTALKNGVKMLGTSAMAAAQLAKADGAELKSGESAVVDAITSAARSITKSTALKFGAIGAGVVGATGGAIAWALNRQPEGAPADVVPADETPAENA